jgi:hypothetical protein
MLTIAPARTPVLPGWSGRILRCWLVIALLVGFAGNARALPVQRPEQKAIAFNGAIHIAAVRADVDGDDRSDCIRAAADGSQVRINIQLSRGAREIHFSFKSSVNRIGILAWDVTDDGDGLCDLILSDESHLKPIAFCVNRGDGTFDVRPLGGEMDDGLLKNSPADDHSLMAVTPVDELRQIAALALASSPVSVPTIRTQFHAAVDVLGARSLLGYAQRFSRGPPTL